MKNFPLIVTLLLVFTLTACSSGSSNDPDVQTSTNTIPTTTNTTGGTTVEPSDDQSGESAGGNGDGDGDGNGNGNGNGDNGSTSTSGDIDGTDGDDSGSNSDGETTDDPNTGVDTTMGDDGSAGNGSAIDPASPFGEFQTRIRTLTARTLIALNQSLSQGELLSEQQNECLGSYDPAIGDPVLAIDCEQALATGSVPIGASVASFTNTETCRASLINANADGCIIDQAILTVNTIWIIPPVGPGQPERPQPIAGAFISYNVVQGEVTVENLSQNLSGAFSCDYDLNSGEALGTGQIGNCDNELKRITDLIDRHLASEL